MNRDAIIQKLSKLNHDSSILRCKCDDLITKIDETDANSPKFAIWTQQLHDYNDQRKLLEEQTKNYMKEWNILIENDSSTSVPSTVNSPSSTAIPKATQASVQPWSIFMSYCWANSKEAVVNGQVPKEKGNYGHCDPRDLARKLTEHG
ncbi:hypothetical protein HDU99_001646, partial [Rhizoclosmatium hyalinum]